MSPDSPRPRLRLVAAESGVAWPAPRRTGAPDTEPGAGLIVAADVARVLGAATVMRLRADPALTEYVCPFCDLPGRIRHPTDPTDLSPVAGAAAVLAIRYVNGMTVVRLAHPGCSPSAVLRILRDAWPVRHRVRAACWLRPAAAAATGEVVGGGRVPVLLVDNQVRAWHRARAREAEEYFPQALRAFGFAPLIDLDAAAPAVPGLTATITPLPRRTPDQPERVGPGRVAVVRVAAGGAVVFDGHLDVPEPWAEAAATRGRVVVVAGTALTDPGPVIGRVWPGTPQRLDEALGVAARAGRAWTGQAVLASARGGRRGAPAGTPPVEAADSPRNGHVPKATGN
jgi:hypothetical protein